MMTAKLVHRTSRSDGSEDPARCDGQDVQVADMRPAERHAQLTVATATLC